MSYNTCCVHRGGNIINSPRNIGLISLHSRVVKGMGHLGHDEATEAGGREVDPRPRHYSRMSF